MTNTLLAIDTSTENCSVALLAGDQLYQRVQESPREHSQRLLPFVDDVLDEAGLTLADVQGLVVGSGPGSFTGVRIGVSVGQGLAFSGQLPVYPVSSLQALAQKSIRCNSAATVDKGHQPPQLVLACIDARMSEVYYALYENVNGIAVAITEPAVAKPTAALFREPLLALNLNGDEMVTTAGTGWDNYSELLTADLPLSVNLSNDCRLPEARDMLTLAQAGQANAVDAAALEPLYVRNEVTWKKLPGR